jgi:lipopolysaccharide assembly outer membrane protein LptD (OstA)
MFSAPFKVVVLLLFFGFPVLLWSQPISLSAGKMRGMKMDGKEYQHLEGNVRFEQNGNTVSCDVADYNTLDEELTGKGNVVIVSSEGVRITGAALVFNNKEKRATVSGGVKLVDKDMTLTSPWLQYHTDSKIGYYGAGGKIVDNEMVLTSGTGTYNPNLHMLYFRKNVLLVHPDYTVKTDTMQYNTQSQTSYFFTYTEIVSGENTILCNYGVYNAKTGKSYFTKNAALLSKENIIRADTLAFDRNTGVGEAFGHLWVKDTVQRITIFGQKGFYNKKIKYTRVIGNPLARQYEKNGDSLMLKADTFIYRDDSTIHKRYLLAYRHVKLYKTDFSGISDSLAYVVEDSIFRLFGKPVLWNNQTRLNADTIKIRLKNSKISMMQMRKNSFVIIREDSTHFSQISGSNMDNYFDAENKLKSVWVKGNGKSIYYIKEKDTSVTTANVADCENMLILTDSGRVSNVRFYGNPTGNVYPIDQLPADKEKLAGFIWDIGHKPNALEFIPNFKIPDLPKRKADSALSGTRKK